MPKNGIEKLMLLREDRNDIMSEKIRAGLHLHLYIFVFAYVFEALIFEMRLYLEHYSTTMPAHKTNAEKNIYRKIW